MIAVGIFVVLGLVLFGLAFVTKRRFGVLGLALAAGSLLSSLWAAQLVGMIEKTTLNVAGIAVAGYVAAGLVVLPAVLLLFSGPAYRGTTGRLIGALLFAIFAVILVAEPLGASLVLDGVSRSVYEALRQYQSYIVTVGIIVAIIDLLLVHVRGGHPKPKH